MRKLLPVCFPIFYEKMNKIAEKRENMRDDGNERWAGRRIFSKFIRREESSKYVHYNKNR